MRSIFNSRERERLIRRLEKLTPSTPARWGRMNAQQMICHLTDAVESSAAPSPPPGTGVLSRFPIKHLVIYVLPWPKAKLQSPPDLLVSQPGDWTADTARLKSALERAAKKGPNEPWPASEVFGRLSGRDWGALLHTHIHHHLKQFGV